MGIEKLLKKDVFEMLGFSKSDSKKTEEYWYRYVDSLYRQSRILHYSLSGLGGAVFQEYIFKHLPALMDKDFSTPNIIGLIGAMTGLCMIYIGVNEVRRHLPKETYTLKSSFGYIGNSAKTELLEIIS